MVLVFTIVECLGDLSFTYATLKPFELRDISPCTHELQHNFSKPHSCMTSSMHRDKRPTLTSLNTSSPHSSQPHTQPPPRHSPQNPNITRSIPRNQTGIPYLTRTRHDNTHRTIEYRQQYQAGGDLDGRRGRSRRKGGERAVSEDDTFGVAPRPPLRSC